MAQNLTYFIYNSFIMKNITIAFGDISKNVQKIAQSSKLYNSSKIVYTFRNCQKFKKCQCIFINFLKLPKNLSFT